MALRNILLSYFLLTLLPGIVSAEVPDVSLVEKLRQGGYVILVRHSLASNTQKDTDFKNLSNCEAQRNLTNKGRNQAAAIGKAYRSLNLPTGKIYSSFFCRCVDTANLAFGKPETLLDLSSFMRETNEEKARRVKEIQKILATPPLPQTNTVLVTHSHMLYRASNIRLMEGHAAIFLPQQNGKFQFVDFIAPKRWGKMLESVTEEDDMW